MLTVCLLVIFLKGHYLSDDVIALTGTLEKDTALQVDFVLFLSNTKNRENLVASLRSIAAQGGGGGNEMQV